MSLTEEQAEVLRKAVREAQDVKALRRVLYRLITMLTKGD